MHGAIRPMLHSFAESLARSHHQADAPWWIEVYRQAFPSLVSAVSVRDDGWAQRGGIDRVLTLSCGRTLTIDEKVRERDWDDILLERWSDEGRRIPGWVQKPLACDFIAYAFIPSQTCYLFPTQTLQRAWRLFGQQWVETYPAKRAQNRGYVTVSCPVPIPILKSAIADAMIVGWSGEA